jgi:hypothetical protein
MPHAGLLTYRYRGEIECTQPAADKTRAQYEKKKRLEVYYDPEDPKQSVVRLPDASVIYVFGPVLIAVLLGLIVWFFRKAPPEGG